MMCHRSPLTVQGRSPLLLLLLFFFIALSSLSSLTHAHTLSLFHTHLSLPLSLLGCSFLHLISFISLSPPSCSLSRSLSFYVSRPHLSPPCHLSSFSLLSFYSPSFTTIIYVFLFLHCSFRASALSLCLSLLTCNIFYLDLPLSLHLVFPSLSLSLLSQVFAVHL